MHAYDVENQQFGLADLAEDSEGESRDTVNGNADGVMNGHPVVKEEQ